MFGLTYVSSRNNSLQFQFKQARKLQATLVRNSAQRLSDSLTGVKCRATSVAKKLFIPDLYLHIDSIVCVLAQISVHVNCMWALSVQNLSEHSCRTFFIYLKAQFFINFWICAYTSITYYTLSIRAKSVSLFYQTFFI